ncbi:MAG: hypothetical protein U0547_03630 [Dehalococcoidia bacterium]
MTAPTCILAYTAEDDRYHFLRLAAEDAARDANARLILYDIDAAQLLAAPTPTEWSGEGTAEEYPDLLDPPALEAAGRHAIAAQVSHARSEGIQAWGWLPSHKGAGGLAEYAGQHGVDLIMLPAAMAEPGLMDRLRGATLEKAIEETHRPVAVVDEDGTVHYPWSGPSAS